MADVEHPKTHVENQKGVDLPRTQPESPKHEGVDPLTETDTMYPAEDTKTDSEKATARSARTAKRDDGENRISADETAQEFSDRSSAIVNAQLGNRRNADVDTAGSSTGDGTQTDEVNEDEDGELPEDAKVANKVGSDKGNTSPSNKPATQNTTNQTELDKAEVESRSTTASTENVDSSTKNAPTPKTDASVRPTNNYPKSKLK